MMSCRKRSLPGAGSIVKISRRHAPDLAAFLSATDKLASEEVHREDRDCPPARDTHSLESNAVTRFVLSSTSFHATREDVLARIGRLHGHAAIRVILAWDEALPVGWLLVGCWGGYAMVDSMLGSSCRLAHDCRRP